MAFNIPAGVSTMRGGGWPSRSARNNPLTAIPLSEARSTASAFDAGPKQPLAAISGFLRVSEPIWTERSYTCGGLCPTPARSLAGALLPRLPSQARRARLARHVEGDVLPLSRSKGDRLIPHDPISGVPLGRPRGPRALLRSLAGAPCAPCPSCGRRRAVSRAA